VRGGPDRPLLVGGSITVAQRAVTVACGGGGFEDDCCLEWRSGALADAVAPGRGVRSRRLLACRVDAALSRSRPRRCC
jgi:hypothetical protein